MPRNPWADDPANFEKLRQNFTTALMVHGPNMTLPEMSEKLCEMRAAHDALAAENAALREHVEALIDVATSGLPYGPDQAAAVEAACAALSTPAPAALDRLRERVRREALEAAATHQQAATAEALSALMPVALAVMRDKTLEEAAKRLEDEDMDDSGYVDTEIRWAVETIRAMKDGEGDG